MTPSTRRPLIFLAIIIGLLTIPLIAMQFTTEVKWGPVDFIAMFLLMTSFAIVLELILRRVKTSGKRLLVYAIVIAAFLLTWAELAVGIFDSPLAGS